jgi:hypothetical protein
MGTGDGVNYNSERKLAKLKLAPHRGRVSNFHSLPDSCDQIRVFADSTTCGHLRNHFRAYYKDAQNILPASCFCGIFKKLLEGSHQFSGQEPLVPIEGTPHGKAFSTRQTVVMTHEDLKCASYPPVRYLLEQGYRCGCAVPLISGDRVLGTLNVASRREEMNLDEITLLEQVAGQIAIALDNAAAYNRIGELNARLWQRRSCTSRTRSVATTFSKRSSVGAPQSPPFFAKWKRSPLRIPRCSSTARPEQGKS